MDTPTLIILLVILAIIIVVVFFGVKRLLTSAFVRPPRPQKLFLPALDQTMPQSIQTLSDSSEFVIVPLPKFTGQGESIETNAMCSLRGKPIRDCIRDCNCEEFAELRGRAQQW